MRRAGAGAWACVGLLVLGACGAEPTVEAVCGAGTLLRNGICVVACAADTDCLLGLECVAGACLSPVTTCGDARREGREQCDDGNTDTEQCPYEQSCTVCASNCTLVAGRVPACGDGARDDSFGETCDDGNRVTEACPYSAGQTSCMVCDESCRLVAGAESYCGDGVADAAEECDDGNPDDGDGCDTNCTLTACGNGVQTAGEECDDGNDVDFDGCNAGCVAGRCGDGNEDTGEGCDDGNVETEACAYGDTMCMVCSDTCQLVAGATSYCGDTVIDGLAGETCDDGNMVDGDNCDSNCTPTGCGNGVVTVTEECDDGNTITDACEYGMVGMCTVCNASCQFQSVLGSWCGDTGVDAANGETCDDGDNLDGNGCNNDCTDTRCGDRLVTAASPYLENCDDGNDVTEACEYGISAPCTVCDSTCQRNPGVVRYCGDGNLDNAVDDVAFVTGASYDLEVRVEGDQIAIYVDGQDVFAAEDTAFTGGTVGLFSWGMSDLRFTDVRVEALDGSVLFEEDFAPTPNWPQGTDWLPGNNGLTTGTFVFDSTNRWFRQTTNDLGGTEIRPRGPLLLYGAGGGWTDYRFLARVIPFDNDLLGLVFRYQDDDNFYMFHWRAEASANNAGRRRRAVRVQNGIWTPLGEACDAGMANGMAGSGCSVTCAVVDEGFCGDGTIDVTLLEEPLFWTQTTYDVSITAQGDELAVSINGLETFRQRDAALAQGSVGLFTWGNSDVYFDDVLVEALPSGEILLDERFGALDSDWSVYDIPGAGGGPSNWWIQNGELRQTANINNGTPGMDPTIDGTTLLFTRGSTWTDYRVSVKIRSIDDDGFGINFRHLDANNFYRWVWHGQDSATYQHQMLMKNVGGKRTFLREVCDDGLMNGTGNGVCLTDCSSRQTCGDGVAEGSEVCDSGPVTCPDCGVVQNPALWLDASDFSTLSIDPMSGAVVEWRDKSNNAFSMFPAMGEEPAAGALQNGRLTVEFDGTAALSAPGSEAATTGDFTAFVVARVNASQTSNLLSKGDDQFGMASGFDWGLGMNDAAGTAEWTGAVSDGGATLNASGGALNPTSYYVAVLRYSGGMTLDLEDGGGTLGSATGAVSATSSFVMQVGGTSAMAAPRFNGSVAEIIVYPFAVTPPRTATIVGHLRSKWSAN